VTHPRRLRAATRSSPLARWQTEHVTALLAPYGIEVEPVYVETLGDRTQALGTPLHEIGGQGVFVKEVQAAVLSGLADIAVHSAKDLPSSPAPGLHIAALPERGEPCDALVGSTLSGLREGALIGTGSVRRRAQLAALRPDLRFAELRGNVGTRVGKAAQFDAIVVAAVALQRLGMAERMGELLHPLQMLPMVAQGALAVECRDDDAATTGLLAAIDHPTTRVRVTAERSFLAELGSGCDLPVAALALVRGDEVVLEGLVAALDGSVVVRGGRTGAVAEAASLGRSLAAELLAAGGAELRRGPR
jgi:hydroxymethylbilane synthase